MSRSNAWLTALLIFVAFLVIYPLVMLLYGSLRSGPPGEPSVFTVRGYVTAYTSIATYKTLWTTVWLGVVRLVISLVLAVFFAWVVARTDTPFRGWLEVLIWLTLFLPTQPLLLAWIILGDAHGLINQFLSATFHLSSPLLNIYSYGGIIWVSVLTWTSFLFLLVTPAFKAMDAALEESSRMAGASGRTTFFRVTLPLLSPAILGATMLGFIRIIESFEVELYLGSREGIYVFTTRVFDLLDTAPTDYPQALALSSLFLVVVFGLIFFQWRILGGRQYITVTGRGFAPRPMALGRWKYVTLALVLAYFLVGILLPMLSLILGSLMRLFGVFMADPFSTKHWKLIFDDAYFWLSLKNTLLVSLGAATAGIVAYSLISYVVSRTKFWGRRMLDFATWLPWGVPGMVMALGFLWAYVGGLPLPFALYGTLWLMIFVFIVKGFPLGVRVMNGAMVQLGTELEESSRVLGASWLHTFSRILAPLLSPAFVATWIILFLVAIRDLVTVVMLYSPDTRLLSILMYEYWFAGEPGKATVIGVIMATMLLVFALVARFLGKRQEIPT